MTQEEQIARFKEGFPALDIVAAATPERGITRLDQEGIVANNTGKPLGQYRATSTGAHGRLQVY